MTGMVRLIIKRTTIITIKASWWNPAFDPTKPGGEFIAHSEFLRDPKSNIATAFSFRLDPTDYKRWAEGLRNAGYATSANYPIKAHRYHWAVPNSTATTD